MATSDTLGLFMSPEQYQAQQMAQQQAADQQRAFNFAQLSPRDQAVYGTFLGAQQLGRGFGGLLGVQDPQLQRIRQRQEIMQSINPADANSLMAGIQRASQAGDSELALSLTDFMREQESKIQLGRQRQAAAEKSRAPSVAGPVQAAARINAITLQLEGLNVDDPEDIPTINALVAERAQLQKNVDEKMTTAERNATIAARNSGYEPGTPEYQEAFINAFNRFVTPQDRQPTTVEQLESLYVRLDKATENAQNINPDPEAVAKNPEVVRIQKLIKQVEKTDKPNISEAARIVIDRGFEYGTPAFQKALDEELARQKPPSTEPERVRINAEVRRRKEEQKKFDPKSSEYKAIQEDIDYLENRREGKQPNVSAAADEIALADFNKSYVDLTPAEREKVRAKQKEEAKEKEKEKEKDQIVTIGETVAGNKEGLPAGLKVYSNKTNKTQYVLRDGKEVAYYGSVEPAGKTTVNVKANINMPTTAEGIVEYESKLRKTVENQIKTVDFVESAIANLNLAQLTNNASAFNVARMQLARSLGDSQISRADVENAGGDPAVYARIRDTASSMIRGRPDDPTIDDIRRTLNALARVASRQGNATLARQRRLAESAKDKQGARIYTDEQINLLFDFPQFNKYAGQNKPPAGGSNSAAPTVRDASTLPRNK